MKLSKKVLLLAAAPIIALGIGGITIAMDTTDKPDPVPVNKTALVQSDETQKTEQNTDTTVPQTQPAATPAAQQTTTEPVDPVQALKDEVAQKVTTRATAEATSHPSVAMDIDLQGICADTRIGLVGGYTQQNVDTFLNVYLNPPDRSNSNSWILFEGGCKIIQMDA